MPDPTEQPAAPQPLVGEKDRRWLEGMRHADKHRRRMLRFEVNDPANNALTYEHLMDMVLQLHGRLNREAKPYDEAEIRLANALAGRKIDPSGLRGD